MWSTVQSFTDIRYEKSSDGIAKITINRPEVRNAFRPLTVQEMIARMLAIFGAGYYLGRRQSDA